MKKLLAILLVLLVLITVAIYAFIPKTLKISHSVFAHSTDAWAASFISSHDAWNNWFPGKSNNTDSGFTYNNMAFSLDTIFYNAVNINIQKKGAVAVSRVHVLSIKRDSVAVIWDCELERSLNPVKRLQQYGYAVEIKKSMTGILEAFRSFLQNKENVYGVNISRGHIQDSILLSTKTNFTSYPSDIEVDELMQKLRTHFLKYNAKETGNAMLNVTNPEAGVFQTQVAIPIDKTIPETKELRMKYMFRGNALTAEVMGGHSRINAALEAMQRYKTDFGFISPAIPFQSIITNRLTEKDTSKWVTRLYFPVH